MMEVTIMSNHEEFDDEIDLEEYLDEEFFDMDIEEQIQYLTENPDKKIYPEDVEGSFYYELTQALLEKGENELYIAILQKFYEATLELQKELYYRRAKPDFTVIYQYGTHLLNNVVTPFEDIDIQIKKIFVSFCILAEYVEMDGLDEMLDEYPQLTTFYQNLDEFAYADDDAMCAMLLRNIGKCYQEGTRYFERDLEKAFRYFEIGAGLDYSGRQSSWPFQQVANCQFELAICYMKGLGVERNLDEALRYFESGAREYGMSCIPAMAEIYLDDSFEWENYFDDRSDVVLAAFDAYESCNVEMLYLHYDWDYGLDGYDENKAEKLKKRIIAEIKELADNGDSAARYRLANAYETGKFGEQNLELALKYHAELMNEGDFPHSALYYYENHTPTEHESYLPPDEFNVGDEFYLGRLLDEPLKWKIVEIHEDGPIAISEKVLAILPYSNGGADFEHSFVRKWLNKQFFQKAFTEEEKACILEEEYYAPSFDRNTYGQNILLKDYLFLPDSSDIEKWYGEGKNEWKVVHTEFALMTGNTDDCWLLDANSPDCPKHVIVNGKNNRYRFHAGCKLGIRPIMVMKRK